LRIGKQADEGPERDPVPVIFGERSLKTARDPKQILARKDEMMEVVN
jgi:hypothetical protein